MLQCRPTSRRWMSAVGSLACGLLLVAGCNALGTDGNSGPPEDTTPTDGNQNSVGVEGSGVRSGEPNDDFDVALSAIVVENVASLQGTITTSGDVDIFDLGPMEPGDRIIVDVETYNLGLDVTIGLFDDQGRLFMDNDDRSGSLDSYIDEAVRHAGDPYFLAVQSSFFAGVNSDTGGYWIDVTIERGGTAPAPRGQILYLDWDGGTVTHPSFVDINAFDDVIFPFSGDRIAPVYADATETIKASIIDTLLENFEGLDIQIVSSDDGPPPDRDYSTIMFGSESFTAYGISETVDHYNENPSDVAIIFTESFVPRVFGSVPTPEELGLAIGNVAAHEAGHLLGLNHVVDPTALMDTASPADSFLLDQEFKEAPLSEQIMDVGSQDALLLLAEILGLI